MPTIYADYGYDTHSVEVDASTVDKVKSGEPVHLDGQGFIYDEEGECKDHWSFNQDGHPARILLENGVEFYCRQIWFEN